MKYIKIFNLICVASVGLGMASCDDLFEPAIENNLGLDYMNENAAYAEGLLGNCYVMIPESGNTSYTFSEVATDDAVSNYATNSYRKMAAGQWTSSNNPMERWRDCNFAIIYINTFLSRADGVHWADDPMVARMFLDREKGEAYGLRAMFRYYLLQSHSGFDINGNLLGFNIVDDPEDSNTDFNRPRDSFADCVNAIYSDCAKALELLPTKYETIVNTSQIPSKYAGADVNQYNRVFGESFTGRMSGAIVEAFRSRVALMAASPAYTKSGMTWDTAADYAAVVLDHIGGISGMDPNGCTWFSNTSEIDALGATKLTKETIWRSTNDETNSLESDNYPPSIYGKGRVNPTQNFVDAFPMKNGYPITADKTKSGYDENNPYADRDPRLEAMVVVNGSKVGSGSTVIVTAVDGTTKDALNKETGSSTRTGYYLRKLLRQDINLDPNTNTKQRHYKPRLRYTEFFLNYAEAANEAYGPTGKGSHNYSAYDVIKAIRKRAGVGLENGDAYLESIKENKDKMRELIRNERRIELSFEGFRFWDIRRWGLSLTETAKGMSINNAAATYGVINVDTRNYKDYQQYGPIPYSEVLKYSNLQQNQGW